jgi:hypothetical protein
MTTPCSCGNTGTRSFGAKPDGSPDLRCFYCGAQRQAEPEPEQVQQPPEKVVARHTPRKGK